MSSQFLNAAAHAYPDTQPAACCRQGVRWVWRVSGNSGAVRLHHVKSDDEGLQRHGKDHRASVSYGVSHPEARAHLHHTKRYETETVGDIFPV